MSIMYNDELRLDLMEDIIAPRVKNITAEGQIISQSIHQSLDGFFLKKPPEIFLPVSMNGTSPKLLDYQQIIKLIDFRKPFLRVEKAALLRDEDRKDFESPVGSKMIAMGMVTPENTEGHYNSTIFLAFCGQLMASAASIHLASFFNDKAPQVVKANEVEPIDESRILWRPAPGGTTFWTESTILKKKLNLVVMSTRIMFGSILYAEIKDLRLVLTPKDSINNAQIFPD